MLCIHEEPQPPKEFGTYLLYIKMSRRDYPSGLFYLAAKYYYNFVFYSTGIFYLSSTSLARSGKISRLLFKIPFIKAIAVP